MGIVYPNKYFFDFTTPNLLVMKQIYSNQENKEVSIKHYIDKEIIFQSFWRQRDPLLTDWLEVAFAVFLADKLAVRRDKDNQYEHSKWSRTIKLKIPVHALNTWTQPILYKLLHELLYYFTEDYWQIEFIPYGVKQKPNNLQDILCEMPLPKLIRVALFSGGLDSFAGAIQQVSEYPEHSFVFVSSVTNSRQQVGQQSQFRAISRINSSSSSHIQVQSTLYQGENRLYQEISQRSRGFMFLSLGAITAASLGLRELFIYENGIGAINLPYNGSQIGTYNSRAVNPVALLYMEKFISYLINDHFSIKNPFVFQTKGEMCSYFKVKKLATYIKETFSCDSFPIRIKGTPQCGTCTSCLLRRQSLEFAELSSFDSAGYLRQMSVSNSMNSQHLYELQAMEWQAQKIQACLHKPDAWTSITQEFPELLNIATQICATTETSNIDFEKSILRLYEQYVKEWFKFSIRKYLYSHQSVA